MNSKSEKQLFAASLSIEINPHSGVVPIYGVDFAVGSDKETQLEANLLLLQEGEEKILLISIDTLFASSSFKKSLLRKLHNQVDIPEERILLIASHAHNAPSLDDTKPFLCRAVPEYMELVMNKLVEAIVKIPEKLQPAFFHFGTDENNLNINRRKWSWGRHGILPNRKIKLLPNEKGPNDPILRAWKICNATNNQLMAIMWNYACHPVSFHNKAILNADFPGWVRNKIKTTLADVPVLFLPGFMGELRPNITGFPQNFRDFLMYAIGYKVFIRPNERQWKKWANALASSAIRAIELAKPLDSSPSLAFAHTELSMKILVQNPHPGMMELMVLKGIGKQIFALASAEVLVGYKDLLTAAFGIRKEDFIPVGYVNQVFGYLPVDKQIKEDGYEVSGFMPWFSMGGNEFFPHIEHYIIDPWRKLYESIAGKDNSQNASANPYASFLSSEALENLSPKEDNQEEKPKPDNNEGTSYPFLLNE